ncbi:MAG: polysaccharide biosynthesis protein [bacterium]|nr:polysaccharide biosynthesis protein [bacterium]
MVTIKDKKILVLGGTGSIGSEIVKQLLQLEPNEVRVFARDESKHQYLYDSLGKPEAFRSIIGDIRDRERLRAAMSEIDIVFNAAALKAVPYCERNPFEAVSTNVIGTHNIVETALEKNIERVIAISTDKAADPTNTYGTTKLLSEKILFSADYYKGSKRTVFSAVRLGNVLGARNSLLPVIRNQILNGHSITVTDSNMTRFVMSVMEAVQLIFNALNLSEGSEVFILKMHAVPIWDLIDIYVEELCKMHDIDLGKVIRQSIPPRPGEKFHEKLFSDYEGQYTYENEDILMVLPSPDMLNKPFSQRSYDGFINVNDTREYDSQTAHRISRDEIKNLLITEKLIF